MNKDKKAMGLVWKLPNDKFRFQNQKCYFILRKKLVQGWKACSHGLCEGEVNNATSFTKEM